MTDEPSFSCDPSSPSPSADPNPPTFAAFSPPTSSPSSRSTFQVHQKSPLLVATPPQVTRALSQLYPYVRVVNEVFGYLTWTTKDPWESFLVVGAFWALVLYGGLAVKWAGNLCAVGVIIGGMYLRRGEEATSTTLDEILTTMTTLTTRLNLFFDPLHSLANYLSTTKTPTIATSRPALTNLFIRILLITPLWLLLSTYPLQIITPKRILLTIGTVILTYHSRPAQVSRTILWRSSTVRYIFTQVTGLRLTPLPAPPPLPPRKRPVPGINTAVAAAVPQQLNEVTTPLGTTTKGSPGIKFTFAIYENQRRWLGVGWTASLFSYERAPWTDEHLQPCEDPDNFRLPDTPAGSGAVWRWVEGENWVVEGVKGKGREEDDEEGGWVYYDNKWRDGRRGMDGWGRYTRRRKWIRNAELVEAEVEKKEIEEVEEIMELEGSGVRVVVTEVEEEEQEKKRTPPPLPKR
ncbi:hypothetical protein RUND412_010614 [Rhizina undulata]